MVKGSNAAKANKNKSHKSRSPKEGWGTRQDKGWGKHKKDNEIKRSAGNDKAAGKIEKMVKGKKSKGGCLPKMLMMFQLFIFVGAYFFLNS